MVASVATLTLFGAANQAFAATTEERIKAAEASCLEAAGQLGWRTDLAKVISAKEISAEKVEVVYDLTKDGKNTARLTCPVTNGKATFAAPAETAAAPEPVAEPAPAPAPEPVAAAPAANPVNPWWLLLPLGLALASWAALRGRNEVADVEPIRSGSYAAPATTTPVATTTTGRHWFVEANAPDGTLEVREHADYASTILRRVRNGDSVQVTGVRRGDWLEVVQGGWVREDQLRYDRTAIRFS
ncbi:MAG: SH3 domain-containing protein [Cyanobacteria bacterium]|jgi:hypothetical protein|nr:SH3 domain-containing protein [Cyanobacteriota bacterium]